MQPFQVTLSVCKSQYVTLSRIWLAVRVSSRLAPMETTLPFPRTSKCRRKRESKSIVQSEPQPSFRDFLVCASRLTDISFLCVLFATPDTCSAAFSAQATRHSPSFQRIPPCGLAFGSRFGLCCMEGPSTNTRCSSTFVPTDPQS